MFRGTNKIADEHNLFQFNNRITRPKSFDIVFMFLLLNYELITRYHLFSIKLTFLNPHTHT